MKRKPDYETESFRAWVPTKAEEKEIEDSKNEFEIKDGEHTLKLVGFNTIKDSSGEVMGGYKLKCEQGFVLYYVSDRIDISKQEEFMGAIRFTSEVLKLEPQDVRETLKSIKEETRVLDKLNKNKKNDRTK